MFHCIGCTCIIVQFKINAKLSIVPAETWKHFHYSIYLVRHGILGTWKDALIVTSKCLLPSTTVDGYFKHESICVMRKSYPRGNPCLVNHP